VDIIKISAVLFVWEFRKTTELRFIEKAKGRWAFAGGEERESSSHSRYYRTQPRGHEYIIYDVIYVVEFLRALSKTPPQHPPRPVRVFLT